MGGKEKNFSTNAEWRSMAARGKVFPILKVPFLYSYTDRKKIDHFLLSGFLKKNIKKERDEVDTHNTRQDGTFPAWFQVMHLTFDPLALLQVQVSGVFPRATRHSANAANYVLSTSMGSANFLTGGRPSGL